MYNAYPTKRYVGFFQFHEPILLIRDPELIRTIMVKEFASFPDHGIFNRGICEPYESLFFMTAKGGWHDLRSIISPSFSNSKLKYMFKLIDECANSVVDYFKNLGEVPIELKDSFSRYSNDAIVTTIIGIKCESFKYKDNLVFSVGRKMVDFSGLKGLKVFSYNISPFFTKVFENIVKKTLKMRKEKKLVRPDMINLMIETKAKVNSSDPNSLKTQHNFDFTDKDITAAAITLYFAAFDTTSTTLTFIVYSLCANPDVQDKLHKEVDKAMASCNEELTFEIVMNMRYLGMVIEETLRRWNPGPFMDRLCVKPYTIEPVNPDEKPLTINPGDTVWFPISALHQDPKYFEEPEKFDPERFNETNKEKRHPFSFIPFGGGPRICIGNRYAMFICKLLLMKIVHNFEIVPCEKTTIPLKPTGVLSLIPDEGSEAWITVANNFNAINCIARSQDQLNIKYENLKMKAPKICSRSALLSEPPNINIKNPVLDAVLRIINFKTVVGIINPFDIDAIRNNAQMAESSKQCQINQLFAHLQSCVNSLEEAKEFIKKASSEPTKKIHNEMFEILRNELVAGKEIYLQTCTELQGSPELENFPAIKTFHSDEDLDYEISQSLLVLKEPQACTTTSKVIEVDRKKGNST
ncbi:hypothetical protein RN001_008650 [Aquatica leii]|uniref:Cytochrome P450 n=1 Tax=Aquatica leii TaxID=1421715 RepID=A0AAN7PXK2_9COLE|nr:hypothetical protein RN001_008650 [Aquatica leii]